MPHIVEGALKGYDWGTVDGLARWHHPTGTPQAELWFGVHDGGPTRVISGPDEGRLLAQLDEHRGMPLVKFLAAARPLSIQVHPDASTARRGRIATPDLFSDDEEKSEMLVALERFHVHAGWRDATQAADFLASAGAPDDAIEAVRRGDRVAAIRILLADPDPAVISAAVAAARQAEWADGDVSAMERVAAAFPGDPGIVVAGLLDYDVLEPGEALAVQAGVLHSYVGGLGVEVMTSSDNVLRLGLTSKAVAVDEALSAVHADRAPQRLVGAPDEVLEPDGMPFDLTVLTQTRTLGSGRHRLVLVWDGEVTISDGPGAGQVVPEGRAAVWSPAEPAATIHPTGRAIVVTGAA